MTAAIGPNGVSSWLPPTRPARPPHVGGREFTKASGERSLRAARSHHCGFDDETDVFQDDYSEAFHCPDCETWVTSWDYSDELRDGGDGIAPHVDDDGLWQPESLERRGA